MTNQQSLDGGRKSDLSALAQLCLASNESASAARTRERFWRLVRKTESCWVWTGSTFGFGHGQFHVGRIRGRLIVARAHRLAWQLLRGEIPAGMQVNHHCDVPACVNPDHLYLGTQLDNMRDAARRHRLPKVRRERKMTADQVRECRMLRESGWMVLPLAHRYSVSKAFISLVCRGLRRVELRPASSEAVSA